MKAFYYLSLLTLIMTLSFSCELFEDDDDENSIEGDQSPMGDVGTSFSSTSATVAGVSNFEGTISNLNNGISTLEASAVITNPVLKNLLSNYPEVTFNGDTATTTSAKFRLTKEGIEYVSGPNSGIIAKYSSSVGDTYPVGSTGAVRTVVSKSSTDDYNYGFLLIKVLQIEEPTTSLRGAGVNKITYWANHRFGLVGVQLSLDDGTTARFPVYCSAEN